MQSTGSFQIALDDTHVVFATRTSVGVIPKSGGAATPLATAIDGTVTSIVSDGTTAYWITDRVGGDPYKAEITKAALSGGKSSLVATISNPYTNLVVDKNALYWSDERRIIKVPLDGSPSTPIAAELLQVAALAIDSTAIYWGGTLYQKTQDNVVCKVPK